LNQKNINLDELRLRIVTNKPRYINIKGRLLDLYVPKVMGILNITPDSFYSGSRVNADNEILKAAETMLNDGADILDIGGYSSRPGASDVTIEEEKRRVLPAVTVIRKMFPSAILSIDTFRSEVAREAIKNCGADIINDISGGDSDEAMFDTVINLNVPYILMHMRGVPKTMHHNPVYDDVVSEILTWLGERIVKLQSAGVKDIIIDPGFGFGKTIDQNYELLRRMEDLIIPGLPVMVGISRKSMIWKTLEISPDEALTGTSVLNTVALLKGADILRVHDVKEAKQTIRLVEKLKYRTK
jgi:dihydropteroate synthase